MSYQFDLKEYRRKISSTNSGASGTFAIYIFICIILVGALFFLKPSKKTEHNNTFYFLEISRYLNYADASKLSNEIQAKGGAGYVYFDGQYRVFASLYLNKTDAEKVCENLKLDYSTAKVFEYEYKRNLNLNNLSTAQKKSAKNLIEHGNETLNQIYENIVAFDKAEINQNNLLLNFKTIKNNFDECCKDFNLAFDENSKFNKAKSYILELNSALNALTNKDNANFTLKYELIRFAINYSNILTCF